MGQSSRLMDAYGMSLKLRKARQERNMTVLEVARKCYVSKQAVYMWEDGINVPNDDCKIILSRIFKKSVGYLFFNEGSEVDERANTEYSPTNTQ